MGGKGSGNSLGSAKRTSVLECIRLTVSDLRGSGIIPGDLDETLFRWRTGPSEDDVSTVRACVTSRTVAKIVLCLTYTVAQDGDRHEINETVHVVNANEAGTGKWYFRCPAQVDGEPCARRAEILYLPPNQEFFACRICHDLAYPQTAMKGEAKDDQQSNVDNGQIEEEVRRAWDEPSRPEQDATASAEEPDAPPPPLRCSFYIDHALEKLGAKNTVLKETGRVKLVDEFLTRMIADPELPESRFAQVVPKVQRLAPVAFATFATRVLSEGSFSPGVENVNGYFPLHRMGTIVRLHTIKDMQLERAADLLLLDAGINALVQAKILLHQATPSGPHNGPLLAEEKLYRTQALSQQKVFLNAMARLQPKPTRPVRRPPAKESA